MTRRTTSEHGSERPGNADPPGPTFPPPGRRGELRIQEAPRIVHAARKIGTESCGWLGALLLLTFIPTHWAEAGEWHWRHPLPAGHALRSVFFDGDQFVAVGDHTLMTSPDGVVWATRSPGDFEGIHAVAAGNGHWVAVGAEGAIRVSDDGVGWTTTPSPRPHAWWQVHFIQNAFVAVGELGNLAVSDDAVNWVDHSPDTVRGLNAIAYGAGVYVGVGEHHTILWSGDGRNWRTRVPIAGQTDLLAVAFGDGVFVAVGDQGVILRSMNGIHWQRVESAAVAALQTVRFAGGAFYAAGTGGTLLRSADGLTWLAIPTAEAEAFVDLAHDGTRFVVIGSDVTVMTSMDGMTWERQGTAERSQLSAVTYGHQRFVAVGHDGLVLASDDGLSWTPANSGTVNRLSGVTFGNDQFVAVGEAGTVLTSVDGRTWVQQVSRTSGWIRAIDFGNQGFVGVTFLGDSVTSEDGVSWASQIIGPNIQLVDVAFGADVSAFVAVGPLHIYRSTDGVSWSRVEKNFTERLNGVTYGAGRFLAAGDAGGVYASTDGTAWQRLGHLPTQPFAIESVGDRYLVTGRTGIFVSADGVEWEPQATGTIRSFHGAAYGADTVVVVGEKATILQTTSLIPRVLKLTALGWSPATGFEFAVSGPANQSVRVEVAEELGDWRPLQELMLSDESAVVRDLNAVNPTRRFYRATTSANPIPIQVNRE
jgi:hypothetical protein